VIGVGSAFFHASLTLIGQFFDVLGMYLLTSFMLAYAFKRLFEWSDGFTIAFYTSINLLLSWLLFEVPETRRYVFAIVLLLAIIFEMLVRKLRTLQIGVRWWNLGLLLLLIAYVIWIADNTKLLCDPKSLLQGHAIWHILGAVAVFCLFRYYSSEQSTIERRSA
jgi:predicted membrane channel-forming protein YqfA (hemolysin III family)